MIWGYQQAGESQKTAFGKFVTMVNKPFVMA
ncbi:hypothetical protein LP7551_03916 [Roseibium album]|jgi:hypothetical protein|nr:hypothetical protein LP7551_03916 [Roseibium album]